LPGAAGAAAARVVRRSVIVDDAVLLPSCAVNAGELLERAVERLEASTAIDHWQKDRELIEAEDLLAHALDVDEFDEDDEVPERVRKRFDAMIARRANGEPVQLIKGYAEFRGMRLIARPGVFIPRDSSEFLAEQAIRRLRRRRSPVHVDIATGGGPVALAVAHEVPRARSFGTDIAKDAIAVGRRNAKALGLTNVTFAVGDLFGGLPATIRGAVDVVTLHPPYVAKNELRELPEEIRRFEPEHVLTDHSADGLGLLGRTAAGAREWLRPDGWLLIEVSPDRARAVATVMRRAGYADVRSTVDTEFKVTRVLVGRWHP
jgi:release factor glutamine methyltransferase